MSRLGLGPVYMFQDLFACTDILLPLQNLTRPHVSGFLAFSTVYMQVSEFDTKTFESVIEHTLMNKLRQLYHGNATRGCAISALYVIYH